MIKTFLYSMFAVFLFALGAAGSWLYLNMETLQEGAEEDVAEAAVSAEDLPGVLPNSGGPLAGSEATADDREMGTPVHAKAISDEEVFRYSAMYRERDEQLRTRENRLKREEKRLKLVEKDIEASLRIFEGVREEVNSTLVAQEKLLTDLQQAADRLKTEKQDVERRTDELRKVEKDVNLNQEATLKKGASRIQSMPPEKAAGTLVELINDGRMPYVRKLVDRMEERKAAAILGSMETSVVAELLNPVLDVASQRQSIR